MPFKVWDLRSFRKPLATRINIATLYPTTNAVFSPDEKYVVTGLGASSKGGKGKLLFLRKDDLEVVRELEMDSTPVKVVWHPKINQVRVIFACFRLWSHSSYIRSWWDKRAGRCPAYIRRNIR